MNKPHKKLLYCLPLLVGLSLHSALADDNSLISLPDADVEQQITASQDPTVMQEKAVIIASDLLKPTASPAVAADAAPTASLSLEMDFFDEAEPKTLLLDHSGSVGGSIVSLVGIIKDEPNSEVVLAVGDQGIVQGNITSDHKKYHIRYVEHVNGQPVHTLQEIDMSKFPPDHPPGGYSIPDGNNGDSGFQQDSSSANDTQFDTAVVGSGAIIDVMVLYTAEAATEVGGTAAMETKIALAISETNQGYENSDIAQRMNLVHSGQIAYTETGDFSSTLDDLANDASASNPMTTVPGLRNTHKADLVGLMVSDATYSTYCGLARRSFSGDPSTTASFQVTNQNCATGYYSFAHEFGHNQGALHDRRVSGTTGDGKYFYGHLQTNKGWRTIMGYNDTTNCELPSPPYVAGQKNCIRKNIWSNPDKTYSFNTTYDPTGDPQGVDSSATNGADNAKWMNEKAYATTNLQKNHDTYTLPANQWHQIGLPYAPPAGQNTVSAILGDDMTGTINQDWALYRFDAASNGYVALALADTMQQGVGYWIIHVPSQVVLDMPTGFSETPTPVTGAKCPSSSGCFETALATAAGTHKWNMISNPYPQNKQLKGTVVDSTSAACQATNGCSFEDAVTEGQVNSRAYRYNPTTGNYDQITSNDYMSPWAGFWFATLPGAAGTNPKLLVPSNEQRN